jgi:hypothetical protein
MKMNVAYITLHYVTYVTLHMTSRVTVTVTITDNRLNNNLRIGTNFIDFALYAEEYRPNGRTNESRREQPLYLHDFVNDRFIMYKSKFIG